MAFWNLAWPESLAKFVDVNSQARHIYRSCLSVFMAFCFTDFRGKIIYYAETSSPCSCDFSSLRFCNDITMKYWNDEIFVQKLLASLICRSSISETVKEVYRNMRYLWFLYIYIINLKLNDYKLHLLNLFQTIIFQFFFNAERRKIITISIFFI